MISVLADSRSLEAHRWHARDVAQQHREIELIPIQDIEKAYERLRKNDLHGRFVIDIATLSH